MAVLRNMTAAAALAFAASGAHAQVSDGVIKIGVLNDQSSLYADLARQGSVIACGAAPADRPGKKYAAYAVVMSCDPRMLANGTGNADVKTGGDRWFFL